MVQKFQIFVDNNTIYSSTEANMVNVKYSSDIKVCIHVSRID